MQTTVRFLACMVWVGLLGFSTPSLLAQNDKNIQLKKFQPTDTLQAIRQAKFSFPNINKVKFYQDNDKMLSIKHYHKTKDWENLYTALYKYINLFGIENFQDSGSADLLWLMARLSEYLNRLEMTKEIYRLLIKHYRGDLQKALIRYDSLSKFEKDLYVDIKKYYELLDLRKHIDSLGAY
jgi:hypothetical protein